MDENQRAETESASAPPSILANVEELQKQVDELGKDVSLIFDELGKAVSLIFDLVVGQSPRAAEVTADESRMVPVRPLGDRLNFIQVELGNIHHELHRIGSRLGVL